MHPFPRTRAVRALATFALGAALLLAACERTQPPAPAAAPIRVGAYYWPGIYWIDIADRKGWFKEAGLNVERVDTNADYFASFDDFFAGKLDIVCFTQFDFVLRNARGQHAVAFLATDYSNGAEALIARPGIARVRDLAGKSLALSRDTYLDYIWSVVAERAGLAPDAVRIVDIAGEKAAALLEHGEVDAILTWEPYATQARDAVGGARLFDSAQIAGLSWTMCAARPEFIDRRAADVQRFVNVWWRTTRFSARQPEAAYAIVAEINQQDPAAVRAFVRQDRVLDLRDNLTAFSYAAGFASLHGSSRRMGDFLSARGLAPRQLGTDNLFDSRFVRDVAQDDTAP